MAEDTKTCPIGSGRSDGTLAEDRKFDEYFGCGVGTGHSGRYKMAHRECLIHGRRSDSAHREWPEVMGRWLRTENSMSILAVV